MTATLVLQVRHSKVRALMAETVSSAGFKGAQVRLDYLIRRLKDVGVKQLVEDLTTLARELEEEVQVLTTTADAGSRMQVSLCRS